MLADDEGIVIESLTYIIEKEFKGLCEIQSAKTGRNVIELADSFRPDIAFMDIHMPGINGIEAIREIRKNNESLIIIIMSAYDKFDYAKEAVSLGVKEYLSKPVSKERIVEVLSDAMAQVDGAREMRNRELMIKEKMETVVPVIENGLIYSLLFQEYFKEDVDNYKMLLDISEQRCFLGVLVFGDSREGNHMTNAVGSSIKLHGHYTEVRELVRNYFRCFVGAVTGNKIAVFFPTDDTQQEYTDRVELIDKARELIRRMREKVPGVVLRTTLIVGHPGEGEAQFKELMSFVEEARFQRMGAFTYSEEEGTYGADNFKDSVRPSVKKKRLDALMELQRGISLAYNQSRIGSEIRVLVDDFTDGILICRSEFESPEVDGEILVKYTAEAFDGVEPNSLIGEFLTVRITAADEYDLTAQVI